jgi:aerobic-type carbon monoxide dehydrogenase small subunit (CoxS/CutS family)
MRLYAVILNAKEVKFLRFPGFEHPVKYEFRETVVCMCNFCKTGQIERVYLVKSVVCLL